MNSAKVGLLCIGSILMSGCGELLSLHALFTAKDEVLDPAIEFRWKNDSDFLIVERASSGYLLTMKPKKGRKEISKFELHLVDIAGVRFADILLNDCIGHMIARMRVVDGQLRIAFLDSKWLRDQVPHAEADVSGGEKQAILIEETPTLKNLVARHAADPMAYDEEFSFRRAK